MSTLSTTLKLMSGDGDTTALSPRGRFYRLLFSLGWLLFVIPVVVYAVRLPEPKSGAGLATLAAFVVAYALASHASQGTFTTGALNPLPSARWYLLAMVLLTVPAVWALGVYGLITTPYIAVIGALLFAARQPWGLIWVLATGGAGEALSRMASGSWRDATGLGASAITAGITVWGITMLLQRNRDQSRAREAEAALTLAQQRDRFARDLHDILGHSLTVITVKAELAGRMIDVAPDRAKAEVADLERLSREALADVRRAVQGYREISLAGEIARAREALRVGGITAQLPTALDEVPEARRELFAWVVREGVTNVLRHAAAHTCTITVSPDTVVVQDDGRGLRGADPRAGLVGLRQRAAQLDADVRLEQVRPHGVRLTVSCDPATSDGTGVPAGKAAAR